MFTKFVISFIDSRCFQAKDLIKNLSNVFVFIVEIYLDCGLRTL